MLFIGNNKKKKTSNSENKKHMSVDQYGVFVENVMFA